MELSKSSYLLFVKYYPLPSDINDEMSLSKLIEEIFKATTDFLNWCFSVSFNDITFCHSHIQVFSLRFHSSFAL